MALPDPTTAARATRTAGLLLLASMPLFAAASTGDATVAIGLLAVGALVQVIEELLQSSGSFLLGFDLAADHAQGQCQGVWTTIILGVWFAVNGVLLVPVVRWAADRRSQASQIPVVSA